MNPRTPPSRRRVPITEQPAAQLSYEPDTEEIEEDDALRRLLAAHLEPLGRCPKCDVREAKYVRVPGTRVFRCSDCDHRINPTLGTPFLHAPVQFRTWKRISVYLYSSPFADLGDLPKHLRAGREDEVFVIERALRANDHPSFWLRLLSPLVLTSDVIEKVSKYSVPGAKRPPLYWHK